MTIDDTPAASKGKASLSDTQEIPAEAVAALGIDLDDFDDDEADSRRLDASVRRRARRLTGTLALVAAIGVGFAGGVIYQKHQTPSSSTSGLSSFSALRAAFAGRGTGGSGGTSAFSGAGGAGGGAFSFTGSSGNSVVGTVSAIAGGTLYVSDGSSSALVKVVTNPKSTISTTQSSPLSAVQPGDSVIISGAKQKDGSFMASSIRDSGTASTTGGAAAGG